MLHNIIYIKKKRGNLTALMRDVDDATTENDGYKITMEKKNRHVID